MSADSATPARPVVLKLGGSVLTGVHAYRTAAQFMAAFVRSRQPRPVLVVVSAEGGHTDALYRDALELAGDPDGDALDLLWSTGEHRSVALLTLALREAGVRATGLNAHQAGIRRQGSPCASPAGVLILLAALAAHEAVVVPGFLATCEQRVVTLGRGGSDWSAVILAAALGADSCVLVKDVDGYFTADPALDRRARPIRSLTYADALARADAGCPLVQREAIVDGAAHALPIVVRSFTGMGTRISSDF